MYRHFGPWGQLPWARGPKTNKRHYFRSRGICVPSLVLRASVVLELQVSTGQQPNNIKKHFLYLWNNYVSNLVLVAFIVCSLKVVLYIQIWAHRGPMPWAWNFQKTLSLVIGYKLCNKFDHLVAFIVLSMEVVLYIFI